MVSLAIISLWAIMLYHVHDFYIMQNKFELNWIELNLSNVKRSVSFPQDGGGGGGVSCDREEA